MGAKGRHSKLLPNSTAAQMLQNQLMGKNDIAIPA